MNVIQEIKSRLDIVAVAGDYLQLQRSGKNWKTTCPFHPDKTPSFVIFPDSQRFTCFGIGCSQSGDLIDLVQRLNRWDFPTTLRLLADKAGVTLAPVTEAERALGEARQAREDVLRAAMGYFQAHLFRPAPSFKGTEEGEIKPDLGYALSRGWSKETLAEAGVGSFGSDRESLRRCLKAAGVDMDLPAVAAFLGRRGNVAEWAGKYGVEAPQAWLEQDRVPAMPNQMLIYSHLERGRAVYLSGRSIEGKAHWNPPRELVGPRQPYYNTYWWSTKGPHDGVQESCHALIVEGQGDALTLAQWGLPALALAGCAIPTFEREDSTYDAGVLGVILAKSKSARITVALDSDEAGLKGAARIAASLAEAGLPADQIGMLRWPEGDANDWIVAGAGPDQALELLEHSPSWLDEMVKRSKQAPKDEDTLIEVFKTISSLPAHKAVFYRSQICKELKIERSYYDELLRTVRIRKVDVDHDERAGVEERAPFLISGGCIYQRSYNARGCLVLDKLSNFTAKIEQVIRRDNGQEIELEFLIAGELSGQPLPAVRVKGDEFERMDWVLPSWAASAIIEPGGKRRDQLRAAIQYLSAGREERRVFTHTGWRELENEGRAYLSASGALGVQGIEVQLDSDLRAYRLPAEPQDPLGAMRASLQFIDLAPLEIAAPIWASVWLAPLGEILRPTFAIWLYGRTGTLKSSLAALALNHYGAEFDTFHFPANFTDTPYRLEQKTFLAKDALLVIDDYAPQRTQRDAQEYRRTASHIIRAVGNQAGRGRLTPDAKARQSYVPRGLVMVTGEDLPGSESLNARLFVVEFKDSSVDRERLGALQKQKAVLPHAMAGYLGWLREHWQAYLEAVPEQWERYRKNATGAATHLRLPETAASLMMGWEMGLRYAFSIGALIGAEYGRLMEQGWIVLLEASEQMLQRTKEERPEELFLGTFRELLAQGKIYLREKGGTRLIGGPEERAEMLGWYDEAFVYLLPEASYTCIAKHFRDQGGLFPVQQLTLRKGLLEAGWLVEKGGRTAPAERLDGRVQRVLVLMRKVLGEE